MIVLVSLGKLYFLSTHFYYVFPKFFVITYSRPKLHFAYVRKTIIPNHTLKDEWAQKHCQHPGYGWFPYREKISLQRIRNTSDWRNLCIVILVQHWGTVVRTFHKGSMNMPLPYKQHPSLTIHRIIQHLHNLAYLPTIIETFNHKHQKHSTLAYKGGQLEKEIL